MQKVVDFIREIQTNDRYAAFDEAAVKQGIVLRLLSLLDWDPFNPDEIHPEEDPGSPSLSETRTPTRSSLRFIRGLRTLRSSRSFWLPPPPGGGSRSRS